MWKMVIHTCFLKPNHLKYGNTPCSFLGVLSKVFIRDSACGVLQSFPITSHRGFHSTRFLKGGGIDVDFMKQFETSPAFVDMSIKVKKKKLKGKRALVSWVKRFRYLKEKQLERMTPEEKILYRLDQAYSKETNHLRSMKKLEPNKYLEKTHDPEVLTPEERFYFMKMAAKCKNYVPVGQRGIFRGVILNMHLHWKKHQTLLVFVKTFSHAEVKEIAVELARLTGGIILDVQGETIMMYRGKNYVQPPTEIMMPQVLLPKRKALAKSKHRDALRAMRRYIPRVEKALELFRAQFQNKDLFPIAMPNLQNPPSAKIKGSKGRWDRQKKKTWNKQNSPSNASMGSESKELSDMSETESDNKEGKAKRPLYLDQFDKFPTIINIKKEDLLMSESADLTDFDEVDRVFLRAAKLLKKERWCLN